VFGEGISKIGEILDMGVEMGIVQKSGSWFSYNGDKLGQGREQVKNLLQDNPQLADELEVKIREKIKELQGA
jgi:recombination protein RecA